MPHDSPNPPIARLVPLDDALTLLSSLTALVVPQERPLHQAFGLVAAHDITAAASEPPTPIALFDGWAVVAGDLVGASPGGPIFLQPAPAWVAAGDAMPPGCDAVLPPDALAIVAPGAAEATVPVTPGEGVRSPGADVRAGAVLVSEGTQLNANHMAVLRLLGFADVPVRVPSIRLVVASAKADRFADLVATWLSTAGAEVVDIERVWEDPAGLRAAYARHGVDLVVSIGGTGQSEGDFAVRALEEAGAVGAHGIALRPGWTAALGSVGTCPVILLPGRLDALYSAALILLPHALARLSGMRAPPSAHLGRLSTKVSSVVGMTEIFLGLENDQKIRPVSLNEAALDMLASATGWFAVPPASEGIPAGELVHLHRLRLNEQG